MNKKEFMLLISIPAVVILIFVGVKLFTLGFGQEILLKTAPVDPRDFFRGDYVTLRYEISRMDLNGLPHDANFSSGETIYASLSKKEEFWTIDSASHIKPDLNKNQVCMKGRVINSHDTRVNVEWGIESYFVPEGGGKLIERQINVGNISVVVSVDSACAPVLKKLLINGEPVEFE